MLDVVLVIVELVVVRLLMVVVPEVTRRIIGSQAMLESWDFVWEYHGISNGKGWKILGIHQGIRVRIRRVNMPKKRPAI